MLNHHKGHAGIGRHIPEKILKGGQTTGRGTNSNNIYQGGVVAGKLPNSRKMQFREGE